MSGYQISRYRLLFRYDAMLLDIRYSSSLSTLFILLLTLQSLDASELFTTNAANRVVLLNTRTIYDDLQWKTSPPIDGDSNAWSEETYVASPGNTHVYVSCPSQSDVTNVVDNWLYTPGLDRQEANRLHINITYTIKTCKTLDSPSSQKGCTERFGLYGTQVNRGQTPLYNGSDTNWMYIDTIAANVQSVDTKQVVQGSVVKSFKVDKDVVYFAFRDDGACVSILSVEVFYEVCPSVIHNYARFPRTVTGGEADSIISVGGSCVENASPTLDTGKNPTYICKGTGKWELAQGGCECNPGFTAVHESQSCVACADGFYKQYSGFSQCIRCPAKSNSTGSRKTVCDCHSGYYRLTSESADFPCTAPPSQPKNLRITARYNGETGDSVVLEWDKPASLGGRKEIRYRIRCLGCPSKATFFPDTATFTGTKLKIHGLEKDMKYRVEVYAENDVSASVQHNVMNYAVIDIVTKPIVVYDLKIDGIQDNGVTISWKRPTLRSNDEFEYEVETEYNEISQSNKTSLLYFTIPNLNPRYRYSFKVRALTFHEVGSWSHPLYYKVGHGILPQTPKIDDLTSNTPVTTVESFWSGGFPIFGLILFVCVLTFFFAFIFIIRSQRSKGNRKHFSDCDGLDSYKTGTLTPDYNTPPHPGIMQSFFRGKLGAPLIQYGSHPSCGYYGNARIKSYVDPTAYEDPNQALLEFANDVDPSLIRITEVIGSGEFGEVCKGVLQPCPKMGAYDFLQAKTIAIKTLKPGSSDKAKADFLMEASIMGQFQHENVIRLIGVVTKSEPVMIVTEFMENGSLDQFLRKHDDGQLQIIQILEMLRGIAAGMKYLTDKGYVHRDLAARNVLVDTELICKIADFGLSRGLEGSAEQEYTTNGGKIPVRWTAPEAITHRKFTAASDVWSFGVVMWEVCSFGERPYWEWTNQKVISEITVGYRLPAPMDTPASLHTLMLRCWDIDRFRRPTFAQILQILEEYCRHPDRVYVDANGIDATSIACGMNNGTIGIHTCSSDGKIPSPPTCVPPPVPLSEFLKRVGLSHCCTKLNLAGVHTVADLTHLTQIDLITYGLIAEDAQRLHRLISPIQRTLSRQMERPQHYSPPNNTQTAAALAHCRIASVPQAISTTTAAAASCDGFFV